MFEIKHRTTGAVLYTNQDAKNIREAVLAAIKVKVDLRYANLTSADLRYANLTSADLRYANLTYVDLTSANLRYANGINKFLITPLKILQDQVGLVRAYKVVNKHWSGPQYSGLLYNIGAELEIEDANTDETVHCGAGINVATLDWCIQNYSQNLKDSGYRVLLVEFLAKDIACIPTATDGKFRVRKCRVVKEIDLKDYGFKLEEL